MSCQSRRPIDAVRMGQGGERTAVLQDLHSESEWLGLRSAAHLADDDVDVLLPRLHGLSSGGRVAVCEGLSLGVVVGPEVLASLLCLFLRGPELLRVRVLVDAGKSLADESGRDVLTIVEELQDGIVSTQAATALSPSERMGSSQLTLPMKPPLLSVASTWTSTSRWRSRLEEKVAASTPYGSLFSFAVRAVRGARICERTSVSLVSCFGIQICAVPR